MVDINVYKLSSMKYKLARFRVFSPRKSKAFFIDKWFGPFTEPVVYRLKNSDQPIFTETYFKCWPGGSVFLNFTS